MRQSSSSGKTATLLALLAAALAVVAPFTVRGVACGHDLTFHMNSWMEVAQQWREGVVYPRWAPNANYGSGEPHFLFYPPLSWMLGAALGSFIPWMFVPVAFDVCAVVLAGWSMYVMACEWFEQPEAGLIAVAYAVNPYMLLTVYVRSAFAEMLAASFFPLLVLWIVRDRQGKTHVSKTAKPGTPGDPGLEQRETWGPRSMVVPLALTMAAVWLTNVPAAIIASYLAVLLLAIVTIMRRNLRVFLSGVGAMALGLALAAFYIVPVLHERAWITPQQFLSPGVRPFENFLFARTGEPEHDAFVRLLSWLALAEVAAAGAGLALATGVRKRSPKLWWSLAIASGIAFVLMLPVSALAYRWMPDLQFLQFPWRWLLVTGLAFAVLVVAGVPAFRFKHAVYAVALVALIAACNRMLQSQCEPQDTSFMAAKVFRTGYGYMGTDEYTPAGADNYEIKPDFPEYRLRQECCVGRDPGLENRETRGTQVYSSARVTHWHAGTYRKQATVESAQPVQLVLRLMNYPAWRVEVNGVAVAPQSDDPTGRMVVALPAGRSDVDVRFVRTPDRWLGDGISLVAMVLLAAISVIFHRDMETRRFHFTTEGTESTER